MSESYRQYDKHEFSRWSALARRNPGAFEAHRSAVIEAFLQEIPEPRRQRLRGLQWKIDQLRGRTSTPLAACVKISQMMWDSVLGSNGLLELLQGGATGGPGPRDCRVISLEEAREQRRRPLS